MVDEEEVLARINELIESRGCRAIALGPDAVGVQGDARVSGPCVFVRFPDDAPTDLVHEVSTEITNKIPEVTRVLREI